MSTSLKIPPLRPNVMFTDSNGFLTREAFDFLFGLFNRVGGSLSALNAASLQDFTWQSPADIGTTTPGTATFTVLKSTSAFACNNATPQVAVVVGTPVATTAATSTTPFGFTTAAQANDIVAKLNIIIGALVANGILKP